MRYSSICAILVILAYIKLKNTKLNDQSQFQI